MFDTTCMICRKGFTISNSDYLYQKIKYCESKYYICKWCNFFLQRDAIKTTGIDPDELDGLISLLGDSYIRGIP